MCRNIKTLFNFDPPATDEEIRDASLQFVRKLSGFTKPSKANEEAFNRAIDEIAQVGPRPDRFAQHDRGADATAKKSRRSFGNARFSVSARAEAAITSNRLHGGPRKRCNNRRLVGYP